MRVGLTYDLRDYYLAKGFSLIDVAEFDRIDTIDAIAETLSSLGYSVDRIGNFEELAKRLLKNDRWDIVFNICEGLYGYGRESLVPCMLDSYKIPYVFSDPVTLAVSLKKDVAKMIFRDRAIKTADFFVVENLNDIKSINIDFPLFAKPISEGTGKGITSESKILNEDDLAKVCESLLKEFKQPVLVEKYLTGREYTVGVIGSGEDSLSIGAIEIVHRTDKDNIYSFENKEYCESRVDYIKVEGELLKKCSEVSLNAWRAIEGKDAGRVDLREDENGVLNVMEINPLAGLHPDHSDLPIIAKLNNITYKDLLKMIMDSALKRCGLKSV